MLEKKMIMLSPADLTKAILAFPYKWSNKTNKPHIVAQSFLGLKTIGDNAREKWSLLRLLSFVIGLCVPENEPGLWN